MLRIGIDATAIPSNRVGAGVYTFNLVKYLSIIDKKNQYYIFGSPSTIDEWRIKQTNIKFLKVNNRYRPLRILWEHTMLPLLVKKFNLDILHSPHYTSPLIKTSHSVVTFHDMIFFIYPSLHTLFKRYYFKKMMLASLKHADAIIAVSESTKNDILKYCRVSPSKISVILEAADGIFKPSAYNSIEYICKKYGLESKKYILFTGLLEPRKNVPVLLKAFAGIRQKGHEIKLAIVGRQGWMYNEIFKTIKQLNLEQHIVFTGYVPETELPHLYSGAAVFVYPSLYEGFGLPVLEAMSCGTPVITSNISSMPEIVGNAALTINPHNHHELMQAIEKIIADSNLSISLKSRGLKRATEFSWEKTAIETLKVYHNVCNMAYT